MISKESILVVDDESGPRDSLRMMLKPMYDVHTAENGQEAINFISQKKVDLVTLDLDMPGLSGIDVLKEIKKLQPDIEVMIVTGYGTLGNAQEAFRYGAGDFISKPFNVADLIAIVSKAFERRSYNMKIKGLVPQSGPSFRDISLKCPVQFSRLTLEEIAQIGNLLIPAWTAKYGKMGFPKFDENYLKWIFGGPHEDRHILFGGKIQNELVAYHSLLYRKIHYSGKLFEGYLITHVTIVPHSSSQVRFDCLLQMLGNVEEKYLSANCDFLLSFSEEEKSVRDLFRKLIIKYTKMDVKDAYDLGFNQFMVGTEELLKYCKENADAINKIQVRDVLEKDFGGIAKLFNSASNRKAEFIMQMTEGELKHHFCGHPTHRTTVIEIQGVIEGFNNYYLITFTTSWTVFLFRTSWTKAL